MGGGRLGGLELLTPCSLQLKLRPCKTQVPRAPRGGWVPGLAGPVREEGAQAAGRQSLGIRPPHLRPGRATVPPRTPESGSSLGPRPLSSPSAPVSPLFLANTAFPGGRAGPPDCVDLEDARSGPGDRGGRLGARGAPEARTGGCWGRPAPPTPRAPSSSGRGPRRLPQPSADPRGGCMFNT